jgi:mediator of RNA polymerase II transcription subunit 14
MNEGTPVRIRTFTQLPMSSGQPSLSDTFFNNLTIFVTGMISQLTDLRELHKKRISHVARELRNYALPPQVKLPTIFVRLSELLPPSASRKGPKQPWAMDFVRITFKGVQMPTGGRGPKDGQHSQQSRGGPRINVVAEARLTVTDKSKFSLLKGNVDHDVVFSPRLGQFALRLRTEVGRSVMDTLATRLQAIDRLIDFVDAIRRRGMGVVCESVTLRQVVFAYGDETTSQAKNRRWRVQLDLSAAKDTNITLEKGNPHLRVLDMLKKLANSPAAFEYLPSWLTLTLPLFRSLGKMEDSWENIMMSDEGILEIFHKSLDWVTIRYRLPGPGNRTRELRLDLRLLPRRGESYWHMSRVDAGKDDQADEYSKALSRVWNGRGKQWKGLSTCAAADLNSGIEELLTTLDDAVRALVSTPAAPASQTSAGDGVSSTTGPRSRFSQTFSQSSAAPQARQSQAMTQPSSQSQNWKTGGVKANKEVVVLD